MIAESWQRCAGAGVGPDDIARVDLDSSDLESYRRAHPLAAVMPLFRELLGAVADDGAHLLSVFDHTGRVLWAEGHAQVLRAVERLNFVPGARWAEDVIGTNAPGTALVLDHPVQIFASEHYCRRVQPWSCAAAPLHDPRTHRVIGAVDITGGHHLAAPQSLALVQAAARAAEATLAGTVPRPDAYALNVLGRDEAVFQTADGTRQRLGRRHSEIVLLLAGHPDGLSGERLIGELYGDRDVDPVTVRAELSRLRRLLGPVLASRPYRLRHRVSTDHEAVDAALAAGDPATALGAYRGPVLPSSEAPGVVRMRGLLEDRLRRTLLTRRDPALLEHWVRTPWGEDDLEAWEALGDGPPGAGVRTVRPTVSDRLHGLRHTYGLS